MSVSRVSTVVAAAGAALALSAVAYGDVGKSPNGPPGPVGNPNQPAAEPQANAPQGPQGNPDASQGTSGSSESDKKTTSHGKSDALHGKSGSPHGKSGSHSVAPKKNQSNPNPGTPRKGGRTDRPAERITICHATRSVKNPYVEITISLNGLHGHGPAEDSRHHKASWKGDWKDIIPAPPGGCPPTVENANVPKKTDEKSADTAAVQAQAARPEVAVAAPDSQGVLGAQAAGGSAPAEAEAPAGGVLGAQASGSTPAAALAAREVDTGTLPFTGFQLAFILIAAAAALVAGFALRRSAGTDRS